MLIKVCPDAIVMRAGAEQRSGSLSAQLVACGFSNVVMGLLPRECVCTVNGWLCKIARYTAYNANKSVLSPSLFSSLGRPFFKGRSHCFSSSSRSSSPLSFCIAQGELTQSTSLFSGVISL